MESRFSNLSQEHCGAVARLREPHFYGQKFVAQTQNSARPRAFVWFECAVLSVTVGSLAYLLINR